MYMRRLLRAQLDHIMRRLSATLTITLLLFYSAVAQEKSDREKANLLGPVRSVRLQTTDYKDETLKQSLGVANSETLTYDEKGNEVERITVLGGLFGKEVRKYDAEGNLIESVVSNDSGVHERKVYAYENGKLVRIDGYDADGKLEWKQFNSYGKDGLLFEEKYSIGEKAYGKTIFKYDRSGNLSELAFYAPNGAKALALIGPCRGAHRVTYAYNEQRQPLRVVQYDPNGEASWSWQYSYDSKGLITAESIGYYSSKQTAVFVYEYDSRGNWIKKTTTQDPGPKGSPHMPPPSTASVTSREITYY